MIKTLLEWLKSYEAIAVWIEGLALVAIFTWDRLDSRSSHQETLKQLEILNQQAQATEKAAE